MVAEPSNAALAGVPAFSTLDAVAVLPWATLAVPQVPVPGSVVPGPKIWNSQSE